MALIQKYKTTFYKYENTYNLNSSMEAEVEALRNENHSTAMEKRLKIPNNEFEEEPMDLSNKTRNVQSLFDSSSLDTNFQELTIEKESRSSDSSSPLSTRRSSSDSDTELIVRTNKAKKMSTYERLARRKGINKFITVDEIIGDDKVLLKEKLKRAMEQGMTKHQSEVAMNIRKRGKNKVAAQNHREKKNKEIETLAVQMERASQKRVRHMEENQTLLDKKENWEFGLALLQRRVILESGLDPDVTKIVIGSDGEVRFNSQGLREGTESEEEEERRRKEERSTKVWHFIPSPPFEL